MLDANPIAKSRAQPLKLMNAPRRDAGTASVIIACPGINRPLANTKNIPACTITTHGGKCPELEIHKVTAQATTTKPVNTRNRPNESAHLPTTGAVNTVSTPPVI